MRGPSGLAAWPASASGARPPRCEPFWRALTNDLVSCIPDSDGGLSRCRSLPLALAEGAIWQEPKMTNDQSHSDLWAALKAVERAYDAACLIEQRLEAADGARATTPRLEKATARADELEARMTGLIDAMCRAPVRDLAGLRVLARLSLARSEDRRVTDALAAAVLAYGV